MVASFYRYQLGVIRIETHDVYYSYATTDVIKVAIIIILVIADSGY